MRWVPARVVNGVPYDTPILGYRVNTANTLRLWRAEAPESFDFSVFNRGDYCGAVNQKITSENITKVLYPNDEQVKGKELRLEQQYFFVACSLQDMLRITRVQKIPPERFHEKFAVQLNDTHPSIAVAELMRLLVDEHGTGLGRGLGDHPQDLRLHQSHAAARGARALAARRCSAACCRGTWRSSTRSMRASWTRCASPSLATSERLARMSLIDESGARYVRMAHLATVGSHAVNGVAQLHTELLKSDVLRDFHDLWPRQVQQQDQRRDTAALAGALQSAAVAVHIACHRRQLDSRPGASCVASSR